MDTAGSQLLFHIVFVLTLRSLKCFTLWIWICDKRGAPVKLTLNVTLPEAQEQKKKKWSLRPTWLWM